MYKVLYIEDEKDFREDVIEILKSEGYETIEASNGKDGIDLILKEKPDLVLCDINMPVINGFELMEKLNDIHPEIIATTPIVFITAMAQKKDQLKGIKLNVDDYIIKPIDFDILLATVWAKICKSRISTKDKEDKIFGQINLANSNTLQNDLTKEVMSIMENLNMITQESLGEVSVKEYINLAKKSVESCMKLLALADVQFNKDILINKHEIVGEIASITKIINDVINSFDIDIKSKIKAKFSIEDSNFAVVDIICISKAIRFLISSIIQIMKSNSEIEVDLNYNESGSLNIIISMTNYEISNFTENNIFYTQNILELHGGNVTTKNIDNKLVYVMNLPPYRVKNIQEPIKKAG